MRVGVGTLVGRCAAGAGASGSDIARTSRLVLSGITYNDSDNYNNHMFQVYGAYTHTQYIYTHTHSHTHSRASANVPSPPAGSKRLGVPVLNSGTCRV